MEDIAPNIDTSQYGYQKGTSTGGPKVPYLDS